MDNKNTNRLNMINTVVTFSDDNPTPTAGIPAYATALGAVKTKRTLINGLNIVAGEASTGVTLDTNVLRKAMQDLALKCAAGTFAFASTTNNETLKVKVNFKEYQLKNEKKEDVDDVCEGIQIATNDNIADVVDYGVATTDPADLLTAIGLYRTASQNPRNKIIAKSQAGADAVRMVGEIISDLFENKMDKMIDTLKGSNRTHWNSYQQAREIIDLGSTTAKARGTVLDELDVPKSNVKFSIFNTGTTNLVMSVITDAKGKFNASGIPAGDYDFKWELAGFVTVTETNVHISAGKELQRKIVMKAV